MSFADLNPADFASSFAALHFLRPHWLWALLALPLLVAWWRLRRQRGSAWRDVVDAHLLPHLLDARDGARRNTGLWLMLLAFLLAVFALAGPSWRKSEQPLLQTTAPLVIAMDLSSATLADDLPPSRLLQSRAAVAALLGQRAGGQVGLVAFADDAFTVAPLTDDAANVALFLDALSPDVMPVDGSRADRAIARSVKLMKQAGFERGDILVIGDHADAAARNAAADAARAGYRVSALGVGTAGGTAYRKTDGGIAHARLDAASLRALANAGGGVYAPLPASGNVAALTGALDPSRAIAARGAKTRVWQDDGYWLLLPLMLLAVFAFRRGSAFAVLLCVCLPWQSVHAAERGTLWQRADQVEHVAMQRAAAAYRGNDFSAAEQTWRGLPGADAAYNRGNALAKAGRYEDAIAAYDEALKQAPRMADAIANRKAVEAAMKRKPPPGGQDKPPQDKDQKKNQGKGEPQPGEGAPSSQSGDPSKNDGSQQSQHPQSPASHPPPPSPAEGDASSQSQSTPPAKPDDAQAQQQADAAQRDKMQRALQQAAQKPADGAAGNTKPRAARVESDAEREKRQAVEAWLRRVPDDPGGLLRTKFRLEHERRQQSGEP
jgi:Ca-activated chloride channel family protein